MDNECADVYVTQIAFLLRMIFVSVDMDIKSCRLILGTLSSRYQLMSCRSCNRTRRPYPSVYNTPFMSLYNSIRKAYYQKMLLMQNKNGNSQ